MKTTDIWNAARKIKRGPVDVGRYWIHLVYFQMEIDGTFSGSLELFKEELLRLREEPVVQIRLENVEAPYAYDPIDVELAEIPYRDRGFHFIRL